MLPSAPYGQSDAVNAVNAVQPAAQNPQTPLLPPNFTDPGTMKQGTGLGGAQSPSNPSSPQNPFGSIFGGGLRSPANPYRNFFGQ